MTLYEKYISLVRSEYLKKSNISDKNVEFFISEILYLKIKYKETLENKNWLELQKETHLPKELQDFCEKFKNLISYEDYKKKLVLERLKEI